MDNNQNLNIGKGPGNVGGDNAQKGTVATVMENKAAKEVELNSPYTDKRTVTIAPVQQFSAYLTNDKTLEEQWENVYAPKFDAIIRNYHF